MRDGTGVCTGRAPRVMMGENWSVGQHDSRAGLSPSRRAAPAFPAQSTGRTFTIGIHVNNAPQRWGVAAAVGMSAWLGEMAC
jgi:hypothetical protein